MKKKLYILTCCVLFAMGLNLVSYVSDFVMGFNVALNSRDCEKKTKVEPLVVALRPFQMSDKPTQVYNEKTGEWLPGRIQNCVIYVQETGEKVGISIFEGVIILLGFLCLPALITLLVCFIKIILAVSKNQIFEWKNIKRLRWVGSCFLLLFLISLISGLYNYVVANEFVEIPNYKITFGYMLDISYLLFGLVALIIAEIYSIGLKLKEEEELTI